MSFSSAARHAARLGAALLLAFSSQVFAHGNVTPQAMDTAGLAPLGAEWRIDNPYLGDKKAIEIGASGFNQNCARCHGLEAISGGIAPDLRKLDNDCVAITDAKKQLACVRDVNQWFLDHFRHGVTRNGAVYMPPFEGILSQEAAWAIKTYLESRRVKPLAATH